LAILLVFYLDKDIFFTRMNNFRTKVKNTSCRAVS